MDEDKVIWVFVVFWVISALVGLGLTGALIYLIIQAAQWIGGM